MEVQNISGSDTIVRNFSTESSNRVEKTTEEVERDASRERPREEGKGTMIDALA